jgi:ATP-dependent Clp protease ATP-binding subunit ClpA
MISTALETTLHQLFVDARSKRHEYITLEHLLLGLLDNRSTAEVLQACGANLEQLRSRLRTHTTNHTPIVANGREIDTQPTLGFQRTIQRAILHVQASRKKEVTPTDVLVAIFGEKDSHALYFLDEQGVDRLRVVQCVALRNIEPSEPHGAEDSDSLHFYAGEMRQIIMFRDQDVPAEAVARVLEDFLMIEKEEIAEVIDELTRLGKVLCGLYPRETAEFVAGQVCAYATKHKLALRCEAAEQRTQRSVA